jgi:hypothetical protein
MTEATQTQQAAPVLSIDLVVAEANLVMGALSNLPFRAVGELITKVKAQGEQQISPEGDDKQTVKLTVDVNEVNVCLGALAELPFKLVADLIGKIKAQGDQQFAALQQAAPAAPEAAQDAPLPGEVAPAAEVAAPVLN